MPTFYGPPSDGTVIPLDLAALLAPRNTPADVGDRPGTYDPARSLYMPAGASLAGIRETIRPALTGTGRARIAVHGHSIVAGFGATPGLDSWPINVRDALAAKYPGVPVGTGLVPVGNFVPADVDDSRYTYDPAVWVQLGTPRSNNVQLHRGTGTSGATMTFVSDRPGTVVDIYSFGNGKTFDYTIDGGAVQTFTPNGQGAVQRATVTGLANTAHTVQITATQAGNYTFVLGVEVRSSTGIELSALSAYGSIVSDWLPGHNGGAFYNPFKDVLSTEPDLVLVQLGANELIHSWGVAELRTNLGALTGAWLDRAKHVALIVDPPIEDATRTNWHEDFRPAIYDVADEYAVPLVDLTDAWGSRAESSTLYADQWHPNAAGYESIGQVIAGALFR